MIREIAFGSESYERALRFRDAHLRRPIGLALSAADRDGEDTQIHMVALDGDDVVGTIVLQPLAPGRVKLRQMAVAPRMRGKGLGRDLVHFAETLARANGFTIVEVSARVAARGFYEAVGYRATGAKFVALGIPHVPMTKRLVL